MTAESGVASSDASTDGLTDDSRGNKDIIHTRGTHKKLPEKHVCDLISW